FDGYAFPERRTRLALSLRRALAVPRNPAVVGKTWRWLHRKLSKKAAAAAAPASIFEWGAEEDTGAIFDQSMTQLHARGVALFLRYSGTLRVGDRGRDQLGPYAAAPDAPDLEYRFIGEIDHGLTTVAAQDQFMQIACEWAGRVARGRAVAGALATSPTP